MAVVERASVRQTIGQWLGAMVVGVALVTALTYPTVPQMGSVGRFDSGDGRFSIWNVSWVAHTLLTSPGQLLNANIFAPHTGTLAYSELNLVAGVMGTPAYALTGNPIAAVNSAIALGLLLSFLCMWALVRRLTGSASAGLVAGAAFTFCPYLLSHTSHVQLLMAFVIPLDLLAMHRLAERPTWWRSVQLGLVVGIGGLACGYYGIFGGVAMGAAALWFGTRDKAYWRGLAVAAVVAIAVVGPVLLKFQAARGAVGGAPKLTVNDLRHWSAEPADYLVSAAWAHHAWQPDHFSGRDPLFPGVVALVLALLTVVAAVRGRRLAVAPKAVAGYAGIAVLGVWASFGPQGFLYTAMFHAIPAMDLLRAPSRFGLVAMCGIAVLAGMAVSSMRRRTWLALALTVVAAAEGGARTKEWGWPSWPVQKMGPVAHAYSVLATLPRGAVVEYPFPYESANVHNHTHAMLMSTYHWQPLVNGYSDIVPSDFYQIMLPINDFPSTESFKIMKDRQVKYVVWDLNTYNAESRMRLFDRFPPFLQHLKPLVHDEDVWLYEIVSYPN